MLDIEELERNEANNFISFFDFIRLFVDKNPNIPLNKIIKFIESKFNYIYEPDVVFVEESFFKVEDVYPSIFWNFIDTLRDRTEKGIDTYYFIDNANYNRYFLYKSKMLSTFAIPEALTNNNKDEITQLKATIEQLQEENRKQAEIIAQLEKKAADIVLEDYEADLPDGINADKLADFISLIINPELLDKNGEIPSYSRLHSKLDTKHKGKRLIPSKNTIKKYLNQL